MSNSERRGEDHDREGVGVAEEPEEEVDPRWVHVRWDPTLIAEAKAFAKVRGISWSGFVRSAIIEAVHDLRKRGYRLPTDPPPAPEPPPERPGRGGRGPRR